MMVIYMKILFFTGSFVLMSFNVTRKARKFFLRPRITRITRMNFYVDDTFVFIGRTSKS